MELQRSGSFAIHKTNNNAQFENFKIKQNTKSTVFK